MIIDSKGLLGHSLGTCTLQRLIGRGGMGAVYLAQQTRPHRVVAVKVLMPGVTLESKTNTEFLARFRREADAVAALDHVNILPIYEYGEQGEIAYLVMPYVTGGTLRERLEENGILSLAAIVPIVEQAAAALDCAHAKGIVHRDLKPGNILFHADGRVLLADFGLAKVLKDVTDKERHSASGGALTSAGMIIGTPEYLSPEQGTGQSIDYRSDIYSLGVMLYQMLVGRVPFSGISPVAVAIKHAMEEPIAITLLNPNIPHSVETVVKIALAKQPKQRFASAGELARAFKDAVIGTETMPSVYSMRSSVPATPVQYAEEDNRAISEQAGAAASLYASPTEETPRLHATHTGEPPIKSTLESASTAIEIPNVHKPVLPVAQEPQWQLKTLSQTVNSPQEKRRHTRTFLLASILAIVLIVGAVFAYTRMPTGKTGLPHASAQSTPLSDQTQTTKPQAAFIPFPYVLSATLQPAGKLLYATNFPGACDTRGGTWQVEDNADVTCTAHGLNMANHGPRHLAGIFLNSLPAKQAIPDNYILQVTVAANANSRGNFGIFFRNQVNSQGAYSFMLTPSGIAIAYAYKTSGEESTLWQRAVTDVSFNQPLIIDVVVSGNQFHLYLNGKPELNAETSMYASGTVGFALNAYADVSFKDFALYAMP